MSVVLSELHRLFEAHDIVSKLKSLDRRMQVSLLPSDTGDRYKDTELITESENSVILKAPRPYRLCGVPKSYLDCCAAAFLLDIAPEVLAFELRNYLDSVVSGRWLTLEQRITLKDLIASPLVREAWLSDNSGRWIFGSFVPKIEQVANRLKWLPLRVPRPRRLVYRRGPRDHGTLRPDTEWREKYDASFTKEQEQIEAADDITKLLSWGELQLMKEHYSRVPKTMSPGTIDSNATEVKEHRPDRIVLQSLGVYKTLQGLID